jgi:peptide/nickel transport system substrate-binding protein
MPGKIGQGHYERGILSRDVRWDRPLLRVALSRLLATIAWCAAESDQTLSRNEQGGEMSDPDQGTDLDYLIGSPITRKELLKAGALGLSSAVFLGSGTAEAALRAAQAPPKRGGSLVMSMITGGSTETVVPGLGLSLPDIVRAQLLFDAPFWLDRNLKAVPRLAESAEPNRDGSVWTIRLRDGAVWHNGRTVNADDLLYSIRSWTHEKENYTATTMQRVIDVNRVRKRDNRTVEVPLKVRVGDFPILTAYFAFAVIPAGATPKSLRQNPIGTGPWKFKSFTPGQRSVFTANRDYWEHGGPYLDELTIDSSFNDETARLNSLLSGQSQIMQNMPFTQARAQLKAHQVNVLKSTGPTFQTFAMRVDKPPFNDVRVRQALRLILDRPQFVTQVLDGFGVPGNDLPGHDAQYFASDFQRHQDIPRAKALLKAAGHEGLTVQLDTAPLVDGLVQAATLFQEQAKKAGVTINVKNNDPATYFNLGRWLVYPFSTTFWVDSTASLPLYYLDVLSRQAPYNETHWKNAKSEKLLGEAIAASNTNTAREKWHEVQRMQFEQGGYIIYADTDYLDGLAKQVRGLNPSKAYWCDGMKLHNVWLA